MKKYKVGFYGGKFLPLHIGHRYCIEVAAEQCEMVYVILFIGGVDENEIIEGGYYCSANERFIRLSKMCAEEFTNVVPVLIDVSQCRNQDGSEDWDAETPLVIGAIGRFDAVYSSEPSYGDYFRRAYPWAEHVLVDPPRITYPISATKIRNMKEELERKRWII